ncbi:MAG: carboxypeptidase-like regulatory domain-containing protein [Gemmatimonadales bacterium]
MTKTGRTISDHRLTVLAAAMVSLAGELSAQTAGPLQAVSGVVTDDRGSPVVGAELTLRRDGSVATISLARSAADGSFVFDAVPGGALDMKVRRLGFRPFSIQLRADTLSGRKLVRVVLQPAPVELASVEVEAQSTPAMREFEERRRKRGTGRFIDRAEILRQRPAFTSDMFYSYPGMSVRPGRIGNSVRVRGCKPSVWIDGVQAQGAELDDVTRPSDIDGIEIYSSWSGVPPQYADRGGRTCGAILVWTRIR